MHISKIKDGLVVNGWVSGTMSFIKPDGTVVNVADQSVSVNEALSFTIEAIAGGKLQNVKAVESAPVVLQAFGKLPADTRIIYALPSYDVDTGELLTDELVEVFEMSVGTLLEEAQKIVDYVNPVTMINPFPQLPAKFAVAKGKRTSKSVGTIVFE